MNTRRRFRLFMLLSALVSLCGFALANETPALALLCIPAAAGWWYTGRYPHSGVPRLVGNAILLAVMALAIVRAWTIEDLVIAFTEFLAAVIVLKLWERRAVRDDGQLLALSLFMSIGSTLTSNSVVIGIVWAVHLPLLIAGVMLFQVYAAQQGVAALPRPSTAAPPLKTGAFIRLCTAVLITCIAVASGVFIIIPRGIGGADTFSVRDRFDRTTGFSDEVEPGAGSLISSSYATVLEVSLSGPDGPIGADGSTHYLRGAVLDSYHAGRWSEGKGENIRQREDRTAYSDRWVYFDETADGEPSIEQQFVLYGGRSGDRVPLFNLYRAAAVRIDSPGRQLLSYNRALSTLHRVVQGRDRTVNYTVRSSTPRPGPAPTQRVLPLDFPSAAVQQIARDIVTRAGLEPDPQKRPIADDEPVALALEHYLRTTCEYATDAIRSPLHIDSTEWFLRTAKRGHCEYFASALAALCRSVGINARVIAGYLATEFDPSRNLYVVRESDAHAWVEVNIGAQGWKVLDATPAASTRVTQSESTLNRFRRMAADVQNYWTSNVVAYNPAAQDRLLGRFGHSAVVEYGVDLQRNLNRWWRSFRADPELPWKAAATLAGLVLFTGSGIVLIRAIRRRPRTQLHLGWALEGDARRIYKRLLQVLAAHGHPKPAWSPPLVHLRTVAEHDPSFAEHASRVVHLVYQARFGDDPGQLAAASALLSDLSRRAPAR